MNYRNNLVSGHLSAASFAELRPGTVVADEFGHLYGSVVGPYLSPDRNNWASDADALLVIVRVDAGHRSHLAGQESCISGRYLEPLRHGPALVRLEVTDLSVVTGPSRSGWIAAHRDCDHFDGICRHRDVHYVSAPACADCGEPISDQHSVEYSLDSAGDLTAVRHSDAYHRESLGGLTAELEADPDLSDDEVAAAYRAAAAEPTPSYCDDCGGAVLLSDGEYLKDAGDGRIHVCPGQACLVCGALPAWDASLNAWHPTPCVHKGTDAERAVAEGRTPARQPERLVITRLPLSSFADPDASRCGIYAHCDQIATLHLAGPDLDADACLEHAGLALAEFNDTSDLLG